MRCSSLVTPVPVVVGIAHGVLLLLHSGRRERKSSGLDRVDGFGTEEHARVVEDVGDDGEEEG